MRRPQSTDWLLRELSEQLRNRSPQLEQAMRARLRGIADPMSGDDPEYAAGLNAAAAAALAYAVDGLGRTAEPLPPVPVELPAQARFAARIGVPLDTVMRRYFAGYSLLSDFLLETVETEGIPLSKAGLRRALRVESLLLEHLLAVVSAEYAGELESRNRTTERRRAERVKRLLAGHLIDSADLDGYDLNGWHLGVAVSGPGAREPVCELAKTLDRVALTVRPDPDHLWVWLGGRDRLSAAEAGEAAGSSLPAEVAIAFGEPAPELDGWRLTHRQARAALPIAQRGGLAVVGYGDVALLAAALQDDVLAQTLRDTYLAPLEREPDGGAALRETLRAYLEAGRNVSSAAAALGVTRHTVSNRLRSAEAAIGHSLDRHEAETITALELERFERRR